MGQYAHIQIGGIYANYNRIETDFGSNGSTRQSDLLRKHYRQISEGGADHILYYSNTDVSISSYKLYVDETPLADSIHSAYIRGVGQWVQIPLGKNFITVNLNESATFVNVWTFKLRTKIDALDWDNYKAYFKTLVYKNGTLLFASGSVRYTSTNYVNYEYTKTPSGSITNDDEIKVVLQVGYFLTGGD